MALPIVKLSPEDEALLALPAQPFTPLQHFVSTVEAQISGLKDELEVRELIEALQGRLRFPVVAVNSNFGNVYLPGYEHYVKKARAAPPRQEVAIRGVQPPQRRQRKLQGTGTCFNSAVEPIIIPSLDRAAPGDIMALVEDYYRRTGKIKLYKMKCFPSTGKSQVPGVLRQTHDDGAYVVRAWTDLLAGLPVELVRRVAVPVVALPAVAAPAAADPAGAGPAAADPAGAGPAAADLAGAGPADAPPADAEPAGAPPADAEPAGAPPADAEPAGAQYEQAIKEVAAALGLDADPSSAEPAVAPLVADPPAELLVADPPAPPAVESLHPIMMNYKFSLVRQCDRILLNLNAICDELTRQHRAAAAAAKGVGPADPAPNDNLPKAPFPIREINPLLDDVKISFKFSLPHNGLKSKVRVNMFHRGKVNILGSDSQDTAQKIYTFLSELLSVGWRQFVCIVPRPRAAAAAAAVQAAEVAANAAAAAADAAEVAARAAKSASRAAGAAAVASQSAARLAAVAADLTVSDADIEAILAEI